MTFRTPFLCVALLTVAPACGDDEDEPPADATLTAPDTGAGGGSTEPTDGVTATLTIDPGTVTESPESTVTFTVSLDAAPPEGGVRVYVLGDVPQSLTQLDLFGQTVDPSDNASPVGNLDFSGFTLLMTAQEVSIVLPSFQDNTDEDPVTVSYRIVPFDEVPWGELEVEMEPAAGPYRVGGAATTLEYRDTP
ncbi:MAG: hypothetical protein AAGA56_16520 [Myxococcota bacterium]